jgi:hypothetical protein
VHNKKQMICYGYSWVYFRVLVPTCIMVSTRKLANTCEFWPTDLGHSWEQTRTDLGIILWHLKTHGYGSGWSVSRLVTCLNSKHTQQSGLTRHLHNMHWRVKGCQQMGWWVGNNTGNLRVAQRLAAPVVMPKSGSVRFRADFGEPRTGLMVRFRHLPKPWTGPR